MPERADRSADVSAPVPSRPIPSLEPRATPDDAAPAQPDRDGPILEAIDRRDYERALVAIHERYGVPLYRYVRHMMGSNDQADDVFQTLLVQIFRDLPAFSGEASVRAWSFAIARHRCLDALKAQRRWRQRFAPAEAAPEPADAASPPDQTLTDTELTAALEACIQTLAPHVRMAVLLRYQESMSYDEIAAVCREQPTTLRARVSRALPLLRQCIERRGGL